MRLTSKLIFFDIKRSGTVFLPLALVLIVLESALFFSMFLLIKLTGSSLPEWLMKLSYSVIPYFFYVPAFIVPLIRFRRSVLGRDALMMQSLPLPTCGYHVSMLISTFIWSSLAKFCCGGMAVLSAMILFDSEGAEVKAAILQSILPDNVLDSVILFMGGYLALAFGQLFICMISLLAALTPDKSEILTAIYGIVGGVLIVFSYTFVSMHGVSSTEGDALTAEAVLPQIMYFFAFSVFFYCVCYYILKKKLDIVR